MRGLTVYVTEAVANREVITGKKGIVTKTGNPSRGVPGSAVSSKNGRSAYLVKSLETDTTDMCTFTEEFIYLINLKPSVMC